MDRVAILVQENVRILRVVHASVSEEELSFSRQHDVIGVVRTVCAVGIDRQWMVDDSASAGVSERLQIPLGPVQVVVGVDLLELVLASVEGQTLREVRTIGRGGFEVDDPDIRSAQGSAPEKVRQLDLRIGRLRNRAGGIVLVAEIRIIEARHRIRFEDARNSIVERLVQQQPTRLGIDVVGLVLEMAVADHQPFRWPGHSADLQVHRLPAQHRKATRFGGDPAERGRRTRDRSGTSPRRPEAVVNLHHVAPAIHGDHQLSTHHRETLNVLMKSNV